MIYEPVQRFGRNLKGRDIAVGDIHGHFRKLQVALDGIAFNPEVDRLFSVGDLVDRGPDSELVLEWLAKPWFHAVRGNHEEMAVDLRYGYTDRSMYLANGGAWNLSGPEDAQQHIADEFSALPYAIEVDSPLGAIGIVHAECPTHTWPEMIAGLESESAEEQHYMRDACIWGRTRLDLAVASGKAFPVGGIHAVVNGHSPMNAITWLANSVLIDTGAWLKGAFTLLDLATLAEAALPVKPCGPVAEQLFHAQT